MNRVINFNTKRNKIYAPSIIKRNLNFIIVTYDH